MRKLLVILLVAAVAPTAAFARNRDKGDGTLAVKNASATIQIIGKGSILGRVDQGSLAITDRNPNDASEPQVFGYEAKVSRTDLTTVYRGKGIRFRFVSGLYTIRLAGSGIDVAAVGIGKVRVTGDGTLDDGLVSYDGAPFRPITPLLTLGVFGEQPPGSQIPVGG